MQITFTNDPIAQIQTDVLVAFGFEKEDVPPSDTLRSLNDANGGWVDEIYQSGEFSGKPFEMAVLHRPSGVAARRVALAGAGKRAKFDAAELRRAAAGAIRTLKGKGARQVAFAIDDADRERAAAAVEGVILGQYEPDQLKTDPEKDEKKIESVLLAAGNANVDGAFDRGRILAEAQNFARDLANEPANRMTPTALADQARKMAAEVGLDCEVLDRDRMQQLGMGALLGVAQGSEEPPALIILRYKPDKPASSDHLALIGKGVTFDTGGVSIKPSEGMEKMKYDMAGGASVIGAMRAIAQLKPSVTVTGFVPAVENHVGGRAQRPGDIVKTLNGKTVEVLNTDAEGRLILIDTITYAIRQGCTHMVDAATLTGAIVVSLGHVYSGGFTNNDDMLARVQAAARAEGERIWHMPLDDDYKENLKSAFADLPNIGPRWGGAITAAYFLKEFTEDKPWVHLDIAGTAWLDEATPYLAKGPSGVPVRTFVRLAEDWK